MKTKFILADEVRPEANGKQLVIGLYADDVIQLTDQDRPSGLVKNTLRGMDRLAFLVNVADIPSGTHRYKAQIFSPSNESHGVEIALGDIECPEGGSSTLVVQASPFVVNEEGVHRFVLHVDETSCTFPFEVRFPTELTTEAIQK